MTAIKRDNAKPFGRPKGSYRSKLDPFRPEIEALIRNGATITFIAKKYGYSQSGMSSWMRKIGIPTNWKA